MTAKKRTEKDPRRGIYILPNIFTTLNLFFGFFAIISVTRGQFEPAAVYIVIAVVMDILDGKIARATRTTSKFGMEYDSLADLVSFGLAPCLMMYLWALQPLGRIGWLTAFLFTACGALRLARFNSQAGKINSDHFIGLPIPAAAGMSATIVLITHKLGIAKSPNAILILLVLNLLAFLMVSSIKYQSFKTPELFHRMNFNALVAAVLVLVFIAAQPAVALFMFGVGYVMSGPAGAIRHPRKSRQEDAPSPETDEKGPEAA